MQHNAATVLLTLSHQFVVELATTKHQSGDLISVNNSIMDAVSDVFFMFFVLFSHRHFASAAASLRWAVTLHQKKYHKIYTLIKPRDFLWVLFNLGIPLWNEPAESVARTHVAQLAYTPHSLRCQTMNALWLQNPTLIPIDQTRTCFFCLLNQELT